MSAWASARPPGVASSEAAPTTPAPTRKSRRAIRLSASIIISSRYGRTGWGRPESSPGLRTGQGVGPWSGPGSSGSRALRFRSCATELLAQGAPITYVAAQLGHTKPTTTLQWYAHWLPRGDKHWVDGLDRAESQARGSQLVANSTGLDGSVVEVIARLEPTIGLEPMTCRLRTANEPEPRSTEKTSDDVSPPALDL